MSVQPDRSVSPPLASKEDAPPRSVATTLLRRLLGSLDCGELLVECPNGERLSLAGRRPGPQAAIAIHSWWALARLAARWDIGVAESYMAGEWSSPNLAAPLALSCRNVGLGVPPVDFGLVRLWLRLRHVFHRNTRRGSRRNIAAHYDLGNDFYARWLDASMTYSSALYASPEQTLEEAQQAKLDRVIALLDLAGGERVLEIGCGWGGLLERLLGACGGCRATGITLSSEQLAYARQRLARDLAAGRCELLLRDYRDVEGEFDRVVSIEMLEAVGEAYWPTYFAAIRDRLRPGGLAVLQGITIDESRYEAYRRRPDFIQTYIFPGGMLPTRQIMESEIAKAGMALVCAEFFGDSYGRTLERWRQRFLAAWPDLKAMGFDDRFRRMWEYYLAYCQAGFETGAINVGLYRMARR